MALNKAAGLALLQWLTLLFVSSALVGVVVVIDGFVFGRNSNSNSNSNFNRSYLTSKLLHQTDDEDNNNDHNYNNINYTKSHSFTVCLVPPSSSSSSSSSSLPSSSSSSLELSQEEKEISPSTSTSTNSSVDNENENENENNVWNILTRLRRNVQDPGLFRWPPHVNLLYPFINLPPSSYYPQQQQQNNQDQQQHNNKDNIIRMMKKLRNATKQIEPFWITLHINNNCNGTGTFGTSRRGVLWLYPYSSSSSSSFRRPSISKDDDDQDKANDNENDKDTIVVVEPIIALQSLLEKEFPICSESLKSNGRHYIPHLTISSNFNSLNEATDAQRKMIKIMTTTSNTTDTSPPTVPPLSSISFWCQEIYMLERIGDNGQFMKRITIPLGCRNKKDDDDQKINGNDTNTVNNVNDNDNDDIDDYDDDNLGNDSSSILQYQYHDPLLKFLDMPLIEEDWIYEERMGLKLKRKINNNNNIRRDDNDNDDDGSESESESIKTRGRRKKLSRSNTRSKRIRRSERNEQMKSKIIPPTKEEIEQKRFERKARRRNKTSICNSSRNNNLL